MTQEEKAAKREEEKRRAAEEAEAKAAEEKERKRVAAEEAESRRKADEEARAAAPVDADKALSLPERLQRYRVTGEPRTVRATRINRRFYIQTPEGRVDGGVGDWIVYFHDGRRIVVSDEQWKAKQPAPVEGPKKVL